MEARASDPSPARPLPVAAASSAYLSATSSSATLDTAPSSRGLAEPEVHTLALKDGRSLAYALMGAPIAGAAVVCIYHHGVPASLIEAEPIAAAAGPLGIAVVAFDRPGAWWGSLFGVFDGCCAGQRQALLYRAGRHGAAGAAWAAAL